MNYKSLLYEISNATMASSGIDAIVVPSNKQIYKIDLNSREIQAPETLSVQSEHKAETVYFLVDRYYDNMDLAQTNCVVQYVTPTGSFVYAVPFCDTTTFTDQILIPWSISSSATRQPGTIKFFVRFYLIDSDSIYNEDNLYDPDGVEFSYSLSTLVAESQVLKTLSQDTFKKEDEALSLPERYFELVDQFNQMIENSTIYWIDV